MKLIIEQELAQVILNYIATKPYAEVFQLIVQLQQLPQLPEVKEVKE
jgi:hypothetical protein